jgi:hypothetical protein
MAYDTRNQSGNVMVFSLFLERLQMQRRKMQMSKTACAKFGHPTSLHDETVSASACCNAYEQSAA